VDPAYDADGSVHDGAWSPKPPACWICRDGPPGLRVIVRKERAHHRGAQLRFTEHDGLRLTAFVTNTRTGQLPDLEMRHRRRARCEERIKAAKSTGLQNFPLTQVSSPGRLWTHWISVQSVIR
jgi:hypothetical protein